MALADLLYRCPACGLRPPIREPVGFRCSDCGVRYRPGSGGGRIQEERPDGSVSEIAARELVQRIARWDEEEFRGEEVRPQSLLADSAVRIRTAREEVPIRTGPRVVGFRENLGDPREGRVRLHPTFLEIVPASGPSRSWALEELRAIQTSSSSSIQFYTAEGEVVLLRFAADSPRRWEELLRLTLRRRWRALGRGEIVEFQPRIRTA